MMDGASGEYVAWAQERHLVEWHLLETRLGPPIAMVGNASEPPMSRCLG
jgi:hypothetical protein